jgi:hypothetical protein
MHKARALLAAVVFTPALALVAQSGGPDPTYLTELLVSARSRSLAEDRAWLRLGHWRKRLLGGWVSEADGPGLFLSPQGKRDPAAELEATLRGFFAPGDGAPDGAKLADPSLEHPQCRFPARFAWLVGALPIDPKRLPPRSCPRFDAFWKRVSARSVTVIFSAYYLNNPASAFGHTFLRLGKEEFASGGERLDLIDQAVDFAATADASNAILYAFEGLFGFFRGEFSARPYFYKVREYADYESRDLWEYELSLDQRHVAMLVAHLWELGQTWFDYYYVTENGSYHILGALEAADPDLELLAHLGPATLPADSVKALFANPGLVRAVRFRPSARAQLGARTAPLTSTDLDAVQQLAEGGDSTALDAMRAQERVAVFDAAVDLVDVRHGRDIIIGADPGADLLRQKLLEKRSALGIPSPPLVIPPPAAGGPERGHGSMRVGVGALLSPQEGSALLAEGRLALHDLADPPAGFSPRTQIEFFKLRLSAADRRRAVRLEDASLVEITSLNAMDRFERRISWKVRVGATRVLDDGCDGCVAGLLAVGGGPGFVSGDGALSAALTTDAELLGSPDLHGLAGTGVRPGVGPGVLLRALAGDRIALVGTGSWRWLAFASPRNTYEIGVEARLHVGPVSLAARWRKAPRAEDVALLLQFYRG